ncbi:hypothetical protein EMPG_10118 [Blastomyces silverae]|uniref:Uncharacterized protein n=1 Tax=Blastomyces silverae TaxID=2060906 RepID=A0A0H1BB87_9EURO|nr:hypothetical protein EMPG_10118 [Blastomyces silverae]
MMNYQKYVTGKLTPNAGSMIKSQCWRPKFPDSKSKKNGIRLLLSTINKISKPRQKLPSMLNKITKMS